MPTLLNTLASFVPDLIMNRLAIDPRPPEEPVVYRFPAAVLFADISGSTHLSEQLAQHGPAGIEELSSVLNSYFGQLIALITALGGDVVKFAGDALLAIWPVGPEQTLAEATRRAAQCALSAQLSLHGYRAAENIQLLLRMCIGAGDVTAAHLGGGYGRWECTISGPAMQQISAAFPSAAPGDVVLAPEAWELAHPACAGVVLGSPPAAVRLEDITHPLPIPAVPQRYVDPAFETALRAYIPATIRARLEAGQSGWLAELRRITILFINLPAALIDTTGQIALAQAVVQTVQHEMHRFQGMVNKISIDDKGPVLVAALGLPPLAHEDDPARAIQAAMAVQSALAELGLPSAIGIATGRAFCGTLGNDARRDYTIVGMVANLAARLMQTALALSQQEDQQSLLLCDEATYQATRSQVAFDTLPPMQMKGLETPIAIYRPREMRPITIRPQTTMIGRATEQSALAHRIQSLCAGEPGSTIIIEGEAGIGKSRLITDLLEQAARSGLISLPGTGDALEQNRAYSVWRQPLAQLMRLDMTAEPAEMRAQLAERLRLAPDMLRLAPLLNSILPLDLPETETTAALAGPARAAQLRTLVSQIFQTETRHTPIVLVLEDAHWFDSASWALAHTITQTNLPLLVVITTRPMETPPPEYVAIQNMPGTQVLHLGSLHPIDNIALVAQRLGVATLPEPIIDLVLAKAQGNPFLCEELTYALSDAGIFQIIDGMLHMNAGNELHALKIPDSVQGLITSRIDRLSLKQQLVLKVASVIGRSFSPAMLGDIYPVEADKPHLPEMLAQLKHLDLIARDADQTYVFKHIVTQEVAYDLMLFSQRRGLHRAIAEWHETHHNDDLRPFYSTLAHHWSRSLGHMPTESHRNKALTYLEHAGQHAYQISAYREALALFEQAQAVIEPGDTPHETMFRPALRHQHNFWCTRLRRQLGMVYWQMGEFATAHGYFTSSLELARSQSDSQGMADALGYLGRVSDDMGEFAAARIYLEEGIALAREIGDQAGLLNWLRYMGNVATSQQEYPQAIDYYKESMALADRLADRGGVAAALNNLGVVAMSQHDYQAAHTYYEQSLALVRALEDRWRIALTLGNLGYVTYWLGDYPQARLHLQDGLALSQTIGNRWTVAMASSNLGFVYSALGDQSEAEISFHAALQTATEIGATPCALHALTGLAGLWMRQGQLEQSAELLGLARYHPSSDNHVIDVAEPLLASLRDTLPPTILERALERGRSLDLMDIATRILA